MHFQNCASHFLLSSDAPMALTVGSFFFFFLPGLGLLRFLSGDGELEIPLNSSGVPVRTGVKRELCSYA